MNSEFKEGDFKGNDDNEINSNQLEDQNSISKDQFNNREKVDIQEILEFVKQHNTRPLEDQGENESDTPAASGKAKKRKKKKSKENKDTTLQPVPVPEWTINEKTVNEVEKKMIDSQHLKIPIALVFDLNGTLAKRGGTYRKNIYLRPHIKEFVEFIMKNFYVMTWTTAKPLSSYILINTVFGPYTDYILCNLTRLHCTLQGNYFKNAQTIKNLEIIWNTKFLINPNLVMKTLPSPPTLEEFKEIYRNEIENIPDPEVRDLHFGIDNNQHNNQDLSILRFDKTNTILLDDTVSKAETQPKNHLLVPEYKGLKDNLTDNGLLLIKDYLQNLVNQYRLEFDRCEAEGIEFNFSVQDYMKDNAFSTGTFEVEADTTIS